MSIIRNIKNMVTLVTGGGSGLGKATVERFVQHGAKVIVCDLERSDGVKLAEQLGRDTTFIPADVTSEDDVSNMMKEISSKYGALHCVVNCAGVGIAMKTFLPKTNSPHAMSEFQRVLMVNTYGTFNVISKAVALMNEQDKDSEGQRGVIVNTASVAAFDGQMGQAAYSASKSAIVGMTLPIARDVAQLGIRVITIAPGVIDTPLLKELPERVRLHLCKTVPFPNRLGTPEEFAHLVQAVVENPYMNAECIRMDGGLRMV